MDASFVNVSLEKCVSLLSDVTTNTTTSPSNAGPGSHDNRTPRPLGGRASVKLNGEEGSPTGNSQF